MSKISLFKSLLVVQTLGLTIYTLWAFQNEGANLFGVFIQNLISLNWSGQFNLDFLCYLLLSGLWIMWRNQYTMTSIFLGLSAMVLGIVWFAPYVLWLIHKEKGDLKRVLVGTR